jgi:hypothetical protein
MTAWGLVAFAAMPFTMAPLSMDHAWLLEQVQRLETGVLPDGTAIGSGLAAAINRLRDSEAKSKIVVPAHRWRQQRGRHFPRSMRPKPPMPSVSKCTPLAREPTDSCGFRCGIRSEAPNMFDSLRKSMNPR